MKVQLLVSEWCMPCRDAEQVWRRMAQQKAFAFEVLDVAQPEGRTVVAEGVEDAASWEMLRTLGCDDAQGFFMSRPLEPVALAKWVREFKGLKLAPDASEAAPTARQKTS
jgi:predicted signal transduction protein with EAL and GGDEF domain